MNYEELYSIKYENCGHIQPYIDELEDNCPDKRTKEYREWEKIMNFLMEKYNKFANFKAYKIIK